MNKSADFSDGYFYHTIDLPGRPTIAGAWDRREHVDEYLGNVDLAGKRVLEIGAANAPKPDESPSSRRAAAEVAARRTRDRTTRLIVDRLDAISW